MSGENFTNTVGSERGTEIFDGGARAPKRPRPALTIKEAARETPVFAETDVLVVGGGPSGTTAAIAAGRMGADVMLVERYNHLGGLSTGGLVIWIDRMSDWSGREVISGIAHDLLDRLPKEAVQGPARSDWGSNDAATAAYWGQRTASFHGITTWSPTVDPEALKTLSMQMTVEQKVRLTFHAWAVEPIVEDGVMRGAIFESKEGRQAILAKTVVDHHYGDVVAVADAIADALAEQVHHCQADVVQLDEANLPGHPGEWEWAAASINKVLDAVQGIAAVHLCFGNYGGQTIQSGSWDKLLGYLNALHVDHIVMENAHRPVEELAAFKELRPEIGMGMGVVDIKRTDIEGADAIARQIERAEELLGPGRVKYIHPDCGFWMLPRNVADGKIRALVAGRNLYEG